MSQLKKLYKIVKSKKVGEQCTCPSCGKSFIKTNYQQAFCKTKGGTVCKDKYWNTVTPTKRNNRTRISPASAAWTAQQQDQKGFNSVHDVYDSFHPYEGLNDEDYKNH